MNPQIFLFTWHPFTWAWALLGVAWILLVLPLRHGRLAVVGSCVFFGALMLIAGMGCRMMVAQRAPVTNMYESVLWAALGTLVFALIFYAVDRSVGVIKCALPVVVGFLILADVGLFDPALRPLPPILRSSFWLMTHVTTITLSYAAFALAMAAGHWVVWRQWRGHPTGLDRLIHRLLRLGVGLLAAGIFLGALWAQSAWGRFWGWDPKETWALVTLLVYLALLHGRFAGWWGDFGLAVGAILAFQAILMAWYGVNCILGQGLHSYGFGPGGVGYLAGFALVECVLVATACASIRRGKR